MSNILNSSTISAKDMQKEDLLVAVDLETTGLDPHIHDMWEIAVIPFVPYTEENINKYPTVNTDNNTMLIGNYIILPSTFKARMRPQNPTTMNPKALEVGGVTKEELMAIPTNLYQVLNSFYEWKLEMYPEYRFIPVGHNFASFDKQFLIAKMNVYNYDQSFSHHCMDTKIIAKWLSMLGYDLGKSFSLPGLKKKLNINLDIKAHSAEGDALTTIALLSELENLIRN